MPLPIEETIVDLGNCDQPLLNSSLINELETRGDLLSF